MGNKAILFAILIVSFLNVCTLATGNTSTEMKQPNDNQTQRSAEPPSTAEHNPCEKYDPPVPDFSAPGRRISETKCYEYIWQLFIRDKKIQKTAECNKRFTNRPMVLGGRRTLPGEFPHMGAIGWKTSVGTWVFKCSSSLISPEFVLTAAHCTRASAADTTLADPVPKIVRLGDKNIIDVFRREFVALDINISRIIVNPNYNPPKKYNDIALMQLERSVEFAMYVQPACLWNKLDTSSLGTQATVTGWGVVETAGRTTSPELQVAVVDILDNALCDSYLRPHFNRLWQGFQDTQLCAGNLSGRVDSCQGDSGGPLQVKIDLPIKSQGTMSYVIGVTSFGIGCGRENTPSVYTRVSSFIDWIEEIVWPKSDTGALSSDNYNTSLVSPPIDAAVNN